MRKMVAISQRHETGNHQNPIKAALVRGECAGIQRKIGTKEEGKDALWLEDLRKVVEVIPKDKLSGI
jgi:hypothetical protein